MQEYHLADRRWLEVAVYYEVDHLANVQALRRLSFSLLPLCLLAPFSKAQMNVLFTGPGVITSATPSGDISVDTVRTAILPQFKSFGIQNNIELRILRRSNAGPGGKGGGGEVQLVFGHQVRLPKTIHILDAGKIKRVRGVAYSTGVAGAVATKLRCGVKAIDSD